MPEPLTHLQESFCRAYVKSRNGLQSYKLVRPGMDDNACAMAASRMLTYDNVKSYIQKIDHTSDISIISSRQNCVKRLDRYADKAEDAKQYAVAGANVERIGKFMGHFNTPEADMTQYNTLIQSLSINVGKSTNDDTDKSEVIDVEVGGNEVIEPVIDADKEG